MAEAQSCGGIPKLKRKSPSKSVWDAMRVELFKEFIRNMIGGKPVMVSAVVSTETDFEQQLSSPPAPCGKKHTLSPNKQEGHSTRTPAFNNQTFRALLMEVGPFVMTKRDRVPPECGQQWI